MTIVDALQGVWLCMIDDHSQHDAWRLMIAGDVATIAGVAGRVMAVGDEATIEFADGTVLVVNRAAPTKRRPVGAPFNPLLPDWTVAYEEDGKPVADGWLTRPATGMP